jgi:hypothetical protein
MENESQPKLWTLPYHWPLRHVVTINPDVSRSTTKFTEAFTTTNT